MCRERLTPGLRPQDFPDELSTFALRFELEQKLGGWVESILAQ